MAVGGEGDRVGGVPHVPDEPLVNRPEARVKRVVRPEANTEDITRASTARSWPCEGARLVFVLNRIVKDSKRIISASCTALSQSISSSNWRKDTSTLVARP